MKGCKVGMFVRAFAPMLAGKVDLPTRPSLRYGLPLGGFGTRGATLRPMSA